MTEENFTYDDTEDLTARGGGGYLYQTTNLSDGAGLPIDLNMVRSESLNSNAFVLYIRFSIKEGNVRLKIDFSNNWEVTMQQARLSGWFSAFGKIEKPRTARVGWSYPIKIFKEGGETIISLSGWRCYKIYNGYPVDKIDLILSATLHDIDLDLSKEIQSDYVNMHNVFTQIKLKNSDVNLNDPTVTLNDATSKRNFPVKLGTRRQLTDFKTVKDLGLRNLVAPPPVIPTHSETGISFDPISDTNTVFRLYYTWTVNVDFKSKLETKVYYPNVFPKDFVLLQQLWYGTLDGDVETFVEMDRGAKTLNIGVAAWNDKKFGHYKVDPDLIKKIDHNAGRFVTHTMEKSPDGNLKVSIDGITLVYTKQKISAPNIIVGWEFHVNWEIVNKYGVRNLARFSDIIKPEFVIVDGNQVNFYETNSEESARSKSGHKLLNVNLNSFRRVQEASELFLPTRSEIPGPKKEDEIGPVTEVDLNKEDGPSKDGSKQNLDLPSEKSQLLLANHFILSDQEDKSIFQSAIQRYTNMGLSNDQAVLVIYQLGVTFGTSRNCCGDYSSYLIWKNSSGNNVVIRKGPHSRFLNSLVKYPCNVERQLLRRRSAEILTLLRSKRLAYPDRLARKKGVGYKYAYMACDFLDHTVLTLTQEELLTLNSVVQYVRLHNKHRRSIVNTSQLF